MSKRIDSLEEKFLKTIKEENLIQKKDKIVVGVSGGPDSITLLECLNKYKEKLEIEIIVAHINHLIRKDSTEDEQYVENICKKMNIRCYIKRENVLNIAKNEKIGTEEAGRKVRYEFFDEILKKEKENKIAIAHNMNDNAETILLNLLRGTGLNGLEGIQPMEYNKYIRPLINISRKEIEEYVEKNKLKPKIDYTNKENIYKRNKIRNELLPYLKKINPNIVESLSRLSKIVKEENTYIKKETEKIYDNIKIKDEKNLGKIELDIKEFNKLEIAIKKNLIIKCIEETIGDSRNIEKINIDDIIKVCSNNIGNKYILPNKKIKILIKNKKIIFIPLT